VLYTLIPEELIFSNQLEQKREMIEITGGLLEVEATENREYRIVRLISSDPNLYLEENMPQERSYNYCRSLPLKI